MKLLLTSSGITNASIRNALIDLLGKPIEECSALYVPTAIYPFSAGPQAAYGSILGRPQSPFTALGWKSLGILELTALPTIQKETWLPALQETDALLVWGGDPLYLAYWLEESGLKALLPSLLDKMVYAGVSAGAMATAKIFAESYTNPPSGRNKALKTENITVQTPGGEKSMTFCTAHGAGLVDFAIIPHYNSNQGHWDASVANSEKWAARIPAPVYAIDDQTAVKVNDHNVEVVSEGQWKLFNKQ